MAEFTIRSDSVDVEEIMRQIRARIRDKRGVDYTEQQIEELARVKLEKFLDPKGVRSDLLEQFRRSRPPAAAAPPNFAFEDTTLFESNRAAVGAIRRLLRPILKLFFNPNPLIQALHIQAALNNRNAQLDAQRDAQRAEWDSLYYEVMHNLVVEMTRLGIEVKNLKMRLESISSRLDFDERRARALEGVVQYRAAVSPMVQAPGPPAPPAASPETPAHPSGEGVRRRRRRRRGRRGGQPVGEAAGATAPSVASGHPQGADSEPTAAPPRPDPPDQ